MVVTLITPEFTEDSKYPCGIEWTSEGIARRACMHTMIWLSKSVSVAWTLEIKTKDITGADVWVTDVSAATNALLVTDNSYRKLDTLEVVSKEEALNEDGTVKEGYISEYVLFSKGFGDKTLNLPFGIHYFIQDALVRRINRDFGTDLSLS